MKTKPRLDYYFEADFADGTTYFQGKDDESLFHPKDTDGNGPSAFRDVLDRADEVIRFRLVGPNGNYQVDLTDGSFAINGTPFIIDRPSIPLEDLSLIFVRYTNVDSTMDATMQKSGLWGKLKEVKRSHYIERYVLGFTATAGNKTIESKIAIMGSK